MLLGGRTATRRGSAPQALEGKAPQDLKVMMQSHAINPASPRGLPRRVDDTMIGHISCDVRGLPFAYFNIYAYSTTLVGEL